MYISENYIDLYLLENYPNKFVSLYENNFLNEGTIGDLKRLLADTTKNIGSNLSKSGIDTKTVIREIRKEISISKTNIIDQLKKGNSFEASNELNNAIDRIWYRIREFYKSKGIIGKSVILLLFLFIVIMTLLLFVWVLMNHAIIFVLLIVFVPVILTLIKLALNIIKFKQKTKIGFPEKELNKPIMKATEKLGIDNKIISNFLSNITKKTTDKIGKDFDRAIEMKTNDTRGKFTTRAILMIIKTIKDQANSGIF